MLHHHYTQFAKPIDHYILENGHEIAYIEYPNCEVAEVQLSSPVGAFTDTVPGSLHFYEHLMARNLKTSTGFIDRKYGLIDSNAFTSWDIIAFTGNTTSRGAKPLLNAWYKQLPNPLLSPSGFESERKIILAEEREKRARNLYHLANLRVCCHDADRFWPTIGSEETIQQITSANISHSYGAILRQPLLVTIVGCVPIQDIVHEVGMWHTVTEPLVEAPYSDKTRTGSMTFTHENHTQYGLSCMHPHIADRTQDELFGFMYDLIAHSKHGLLHKLLRDEDAEVYGIGMDTHETWHRYGSIEIEGIQNSSTRTMIVDKIVRVLTTEALSDHIKKHFDSVKRDYVMRYKHQELHESVSARSLAGFMRVKGYTTPAPKHILQRSSADELTELARHILDPKKMGFVLLDPTLA